jgi:hypothetical protein
MLFMLFSCCSNPAKVDFIHCTRFIRALGCKHSMATLLQLLIGTLSCVVFVLVARQAGQKREMILYAAALIIAALIYVGFAVAGGATVSCLVLESGGLVLFSLVALFGLRSVWVLTIGWATHAVWDVLLHKVLEGGFVPEWSPVVCIGFDLFLAGYIAARRVDSGWRKKLNVRINRNAETTK